MALKKCISLWRGDLKRNNRQQDHNAVAKRSMLDMLPLVCQGLSMHYLETIFPGNRRIKSGEKFRSRPGKPNQRKGQNEKFMNFAHFCEFWCLSSGKHARFTLNFCSGMPLRKVHELTFLWFGLPGPTAVTMFAKSSPKLSPIRAQATVLSCNNWHTLFEFHLLLQL